MNSSFHRSGDQVWQSSEITKSHAHVLQAEVSSPSPVCSTYVFSPTGEKLASNSDRLFMQLSVTRATWRMGLIGTLLLCSSNLSASFPFRLLCHYWLLCNMVHWGDNGVAPHSHCIKLEAGVFAADITSLLLPHSSWRMVANPAFDLVASVYKMKYVKWKEIQDCVPSELYNNAGFCDKPACVYAAWRCTGTAGEWSILNKDNVLSLGDPLVFCFVFSSSWIYKWFLVGQVGGPF